MAFQLLVHQHDNYIDQSVSLVKLVPSFWTYKVFGIIPVWLLLLLLVIFSIAFFAIRYYKKQLEKKKRFHIKVDYNKIPAEGERSLFVGNIAETNRGAHFDMDKLTMHTIVAGSTGGGKSIAAQDIVEECLEKNIAVLAFDPTAKWTGMLRKCTDKGFLKLYSKFGMKQSDAHPYKGNIKDIRNAREIIKLNDFVKPGEIQVFTTNRLDPKDYDIFIANTIREIFQSNLKESRQLEVLMIFDEIHRILPKFGGTSQGFIQIERACREFRKWGIGLMLISQVMDDLVGDIKANINTQIQMKTRDEKDLNRIKMNYGAEYIQSLIKSPVGSGLVSNSGWNNGTPYFITFRPIKHSVERLVNDEIDDYTRYNNIIDDLEYQYEQLEEDKIDVFDLKVELKLAKDKVKTGNFNMVKIYLEGLQMRTEKIWAKLGKKAKKKETYVIDEKTLREELEKAKLARMKYESEQRKKEGK